jgi:hypothetical protein
MGAPRTGPRPEPKERVRLVSKWMTDEEVEEWLQTFSQHEQFRTLFHREKKGDR